MPAVDPELGSTAASRAAAPAGAALRRSPLRRDRVLVASFVVYFLFLGSLWTLYCCATLPAVKITPFDDIATPGETVRVRAKLERDGPGFINPDVADAEVTFRFLDGWADTSSAGSDGEGIARVEVAAPAQAGEYRFLANPSDRRRFVVARDRLVAGALFVVPADAPIIVCDIDNTVTAGRTYKILGKGEGPAVAPGAAEALSHLAQNHRILFVTARDDSLLNDTRGWLEENGFPRNGPVIGRDWSLANAGKEGETKLVELKRLQERFSNILWGIGNTDSDCLAYREAGIPHINRAESGCTGHAGAPRCVVLESWPAIDQFLAKELAPK